MALRSAGVSRAAIAATQHPGYRSGAYYGFDSIASVTGTMAADTIYAFPIPIAAAVRTNFAAIRVAVATPGVFGKIALYTNILADGRLIQEGDAAFEMNPVNSIQGALFAGSPTLPPGILWVATKFNGAAQPNVVDHANNANVRVFNMMGQPSANPFIVNSSAIASARRADAYANAFPATFGAVTWTAGAPGAPVATFAAV